MDFKIVFYKDVDKETWEQWVEQFDQASYFHSWNWLKYCLQFPHIAEHLSFVVLDQAGKPIGLCPLGISRNKEKGYFEGSFSGIPLGVPLSPLSHHRYRRDVMDYIFSIVRKYVLQFNAKKTFMIYHSVHRAMCMNKSAVDKYSFDLIRFGYLPHVGNVAVVDLTLPEGVLLENISKYHRRNIVRGKKKGVYVKAYNSKENRESLAELFLQYQKAHFVSARCLTRPQGTWDAMRQDADRGDASLFVAFVENTPISFLFCGEFFSMAFGWSQVNIEDCEKEYSPRHVLEWEAMMYYKKEGFKFYVLGYIYYGPQLFYVPSKKERNISVFKERYGGFLMPAISWHGYYDLDLMKSELHGRMSEFLDTPFDISAKEENKCQ